MASSSLDFDRVDSAMCTTPRLAAADEPVDCVVGARNAKSSFHQKEMQLKVSYCALCWPQG